MKTIKKVFKVIGFFVCILFVFVGILAVYNQIATRAEANEIRPNGKMVDLGGYRVHVYTEGENPAAPTLVFLSGSATVAPVYDFKALYSLLSGEYRIAVVEKAGYGYADIVDVARDAASMVKEVRSALSKTEISGPYVLVPHSMSGLEALYWAQNHPEEVAGIVGIDMSVPYSYDDASISGKAKRMATLGRLCKNLGLFRIPGIYPVNEAPLTRTEAQQQRLLIHRNAINAVYLAEGDAVYRNAQTVKAGGTVSCPILMFCSDGTEIGDFWIPTQKRFAKENNATILFFDCGHYLHHYKSEEMTAFIRAFLEQVST